MPARGSVFIASLLAACMAACTSPLDERKNKYEPWYYDPQTDEIYILKDLVRKEHYDKVAKVLEHYCKHYHRLGPAEIEFSNPVDVALMMNYRKKAEDPEWWSRHIADSGRRCPVEN